MGAFSFSFALERAETISSNVELHRRVKALRIKALRTLGYAAAIGQTVTTPVRVDAEIGYPTARKADPANLWPTVKALTDGMTDAGLWPDDNSEHIPLITFARGPKSPKGVYVVTIFVTELEVRPE